MNILLDDKIQMVFQTFTNHMQNWSGQNKFFWERWSCIGSSVVLMIILTKILIVLAWGSWSTNVGWMVLWLSIILIPLIRGMGAANHIRAEEKQFLETGNLVRDKHRASAATARVLLASFATTLVLSIPIGILITPLLPEIVIIMLPFGLTTMHILCTAFVASVLCEDYFYLCIPKPPSKSKAIRSIKKLLPAASNRIYLQA